MIKNRDDRIIIEKQSNILDIYDSLVEVSSLYDPPLIEVVGDLNAHAIKLAKTAEVYIAKDNSPIGFIAFYCNNEANKVGYITQIGVKKETQSSGIGKRLMNVAYSTCKEKGMKIIRLEVSKLNNKAIRFYEKEGFKYYEDASKSSIYMEKTI